jgi:hypothetical protein
MAMAENTRIVQEREEFWDAMSAFESAILHRRKYLTHQAGKKFPVSFSPQIKQSSNAYVFFSQDFYAKSEYEKNLTIMGFSELHQHDKLSALGELWNGMNEDAKQVLESLIIGLAIQSRSIT